MGNYFYKDSVTTTNDLNNSLNKVKNLNWEMKEQTDSENKSLKSYAITIGENIDSLDWEIDGDIIQKVCDNIEYDGTSDVCYVKNTGLDCFLCTDTKEYLHVNNMGISEYPILVCLLDEKSEIIIGEGRMLYGLRFKRTEKFLKDVEDIKAGKKSFSHGKLNYSSGMVGIKL